MSVEQARLLRAAGEHERALALLTALAAATADPEIHYEAACAHDYLGREAQAVPYYVTALAGALPAPLKRSAYLGLGSTYRTLGRYAESETTLRRGLAEFPNAPELQVFLAMTLHNLGRSKEAVETLLKIVAATSSDPEIRGYAGAIEFYAQDIERIWPA